MLYGLNSLDLPVTGRHDPSPRHPDVLLVEDRPSFQLRAIATAEREIVRAGQRKAEGRIRLQCVDYLEVTVEVTGWCVDACCQSGSGSTPVGRSRSQQRQQRNICFRSDAAVRSNLFV